MATATAHVQHVHTSTPSHLLAMAVSRPGGVRRNSSSCSGFRSGSSTTTSSISSASVASDASSGSDTSRSSFGPKASHHPLHSSASVRQLLSVLDRLPGCSGSLRRVVQRTADTHDIHISESVQRFNQPTSGESTVCESKRSFGYDVLASDEDVRLPVVEALQEFWHLKSERTARRELSSPTNASVVYQIIKPRMRSEEFVAFATLPGGSCFSSPEQCLTQGEARRSAARVALINSVCNDLPTRRVTDNYIRRVLGAAAKEVSTGPLTQMTPRHSASLSSTPARASRASTIDQRSTLEASWSYLDVFHRLLLRNKGRSHLELKERITVFQLMQWNGDFQKARRNGLSLESALEMSLTTVLDDRLRFHFASSWAKAESLTRGKIGRELQIVKQELDRLRSSGRELRCTKEKKDILQDAYALYQRGEAKQRAAERKEFSPFDQWTGRPSSGHHSSHAPSAVHHQQYSTHSRYSGDVTARSDAFSTRRTIAARR